MKEQKKESFLKRLFGGGSSCCGDFELEQKEENSQNTEKSENSNNSVPKPEDKSGGCNCSCG